MTNDIVEILKEPRMVTICAPMVRYSKLQFRSLVRRYKCDICFTPMILADSFVQSSKARDNEFATNNNDKPLVVQFAAKESNDFAAAAEMVAPYCNGVDLNCGCPQRWAMNDGYGADLLKYPEKIRDLILQVLNRIPRPFSVSVKIRLLKNIGETINLCRILEKTGVSFLTVHARTPSMRNEPIDLDGLKAVRDSVQCPLIANGDAKDLSSAQLLYDVSKCQGVMAARGLLTNPSLFSGSAVTSMSCVQDWLDITSVIPTQFLTFHHHLVFMLEKILDKRSRQYFNNLHDKDAVLEFMNNHFGMQPNTASNDSIYPIKCDFNTKISRLQTKKINDFELESSDDFLGNIFNET